MPRKAIAFCRTQIFTKKPSSPKISCTPEGSETTENAQKWFSNALHFVERYHFVGISCPFDRASTICMTSIRSLKKNFAHECKWKHFPLLAQRILWCELHQKAKCYRPIFVIKRIFPYKMWDSTKWHIYIYIYIQWNWSKHTWMSTYLSTKWLLDISSFSYNMVGFYLQKYRSITLRGLRGDLL